MRFFVFLVCCGSDSFPFILQNGKAASRVSWRCQANNRNRAAFLFGVNTHSSLKMGRCRRYKEVALGFLFGYAQRLLQFPKAAYSRNNKPISTKSLWAFCEHISLLTCILSIVIVQPGKMVMLFTVWDGVKAVRRLAVYGIHCIELQSCTPFFEGNHCAIV